MARIYQLDAINQDDIVSTDVMPMEDSGGTTTYKLSIGGIFNYIFGGGAGNDESLDLDNINLGVGSAAEEGTELIAIGHSAEATGNQSIAIGPSSSASNTKASAVGYQNTASGNWGCSAFGYRNNAEESQCVAFGHKNLATGDYESVAVGSNNTASGQQDSALGVANDVNGTRSSAVGYQNETSGNWGCSAFGYRNNADYSQCVAFGHKNTASDNYEAVAMGSNNLATGQQSSALGVRNNVSGSYASAIGYQAYARCETTVNIGGMIIVRADDGEDGTEIQKYSGVSNILMSGDVDFTSIQTITIDFPMGCSFYVDEVGVILDNVLSNMTIQPTISFGNNSSATAISNASITTGLTNINSRKRITELNTYNGQPTLTATITVAATADYMHGRFYWKGMLVESTPIGS